MGDLHGVGDSPRRSLKWAAAWTSAGLSVLFLVVYGACNWITAHRSDVGTWYYQWERYIPFVPLMIVPYMSIDLFFVAGPFLCRDPKELRTLARRIGFAILAAGACFLLFPLRFAFERPEAGGLLGTIFDWFRGMDQPYNQLPSLHITLRTILAHLYVRHTAGLPRVGVRVWFSLIGFSTLLTYQHHFVDIVGGFVLAGVCFYLFREESPRLPVTRNLRIGLYYGMGAVALVGVTALTWPRGGLLLWPALALAIAMSAYCGVGPGIYRKTDGRLPFSTWFVLAPTLLGQHLSLVYYRRKCRPWDEIKPHLWIGRKLSNAEAAEAVRGGVTGVLDLTVEFSEAAPFLAVNYRHLPILDLTAPTLEQLKAAAEFIEENTARGIVYVHCKVGYSRTAAVVGAYLLASRQAASAEDAVSLLQKARPSIIVRPEAWAALRAFDHARGAEPAGEIAP